MLKTRQNAKTDVRSSIRQNKPQSAHPKTAQNSNRSDLISRSQKLLNAFNKGSKSSNRLVTPSTPGGGENQRIEKEPSPTRKKRPRFSAHLSRIQKLREVAGIQGPMTGPASPKEAKRKKSERASSARKRVLGTPGGVAHVN